MKQLTRVINEAFAKAYPDVGLIIEATEDEIILCKRVAMLADDLRCTRINFTVTNKAYADLDRRHRGIRNHWWEFWRRHG